jgi:hypothetical protein
MLTRAVQCAFKLHHRGIERGQALRLLAGEQEPKKRRVKNNRMGRIADW